MIVAIAIVVSFFLIKGYFKTSNPDVYTYEGPGGIYTFNIIHEGEETSHIVAAYVDNHEYLIPLRYGPKELEDIPLDKTSIDYITKSGTRPKTGIYITQDPKLPEITDSDSALAVVEINKVTGQAYYSIYKIPTITAVTRETEGSVSADLPVITCDDANEDISVILIKLGDSNRIYTENTCVILEAKDGKDIFKVADKLVLHLIGVF